MVRSYEERILGGICGGLGRKTGLNVWFWRFFWIVSVPLTGGSSILLYILLWWTLPQPLPTESQRGRIFIAIALAFLIIGGWLLRERFTGASGDSLYWPAMALLAGIIFFLRQFGTNLRTNPLVGLVWIATAAVILSVHLGLVPSGIADLIERSWPVLLVFSGLMIFLRDRIQFGSFVALILSVFIIGGIATTAFSARSGQARDEKQITIAESVGDNIQLLQVNLEVLTTNIEILSLETTARDIQATFAGSEESDIVWEYEESAEGLATFTLRETRANPFPRLDAIGRGRMSIALPRNLATSIAFKNQDGIATFNLGQLALERLDLDVYKGDVVITMPAYNPLSPSVQQNPGNLVVRDGNITIRVPEDVGGRFVLNRDLSRRPEHDTTRYLLIDDGAGGILQHINFEALDIKVNYIVTVVRGVIRLEVYE